MFQFDDSNILQRNAITPIDSYNLTDGFALAWIFFAALSTGLLMLNINPFTLALTAFSLSLAGIWWLLSHWRRC